MTTDLLDLYSDVSDPNGEPIAVWERVSTVMTRQDIASQTKDLKAFISAGSYLVTRVFRMEASAYKGKHADQLAEMLADIAAGNYKIVVSAMSSRYERRGWQAAMVTALQVHQLGGKIVAIDDENYGDMSSVMGAFGTIMKAESNKDYSKAISENLNRANRLRDAEGWFRGAIPGGYQALGEKGQKYLEPHSVTGAAVTQAFIDAANGSSTPVIARRFRDVNDQVGKRITTPKGRRGYKMPDGVAKLPITADGVAKLLRSEVYSSGRHTWVNESGETCSHKCEPLTTPAQQRLAIAAIESRRTGDNVSSRAIAKEDFSGVVQCAHDLGRMYRYFGGSKKRKDGTRSPKVRRYTCETCGKSVNADKTDAEIQRKMSANTQPWFEARTVDPGADIDRQIDDVNRELDGLFATARREGWTRAERNAKQEQLEDRLDQLTELRATAGDSYTFAEIKRDENGNALTEADRWNGMSFAVQRDYLSYEDWHVLAKAAPGRTGDVLVTIERDESE